MNPPTEVVVECPVMDYTDMGKDDEVVREFLQYEEDGSVVIDRDDEVIMEAMDNARNSILDRIDNQDFPTKKQYRIVFEGGVHLSSDVLKIHEGFKDSNRLSLRPLPIDFVVTKSWETILDDLTWDDVAVQDLELPKSDDDQMKEKKQVIIIRQPTVTVHRLLIELADLNKDARKKGKVVKAVDTSGATAMMAAMNKKKKKKGTS